MFLFLVLFLTSGKYLLPSIEKSIRLSRYFQTLRSQQIKLGHVRLARVRCSYHLLNRFSAFCFT